MKHTFSVLAAVILLFIRGGTLAHAQTVIQEITGTVEVKAPGSSTWVQAAAGMELAQKTSISTGFKGTAVVAVGNSRITVKPMTRLTLEEIIATAGGNEQVNLFLQSGRVRAEVTSPSGGKTDFTVRSPTVTASVRGTVFEFDTINLNVIEGRVLFFSATGSLTPVRAGETSTVREQTYLVTPPQEIGALTFMPDFPPGTESGGRISGGGSNIPGTPGTPGIPDTPDTPDTPGNVDLPVGVDW
jgi:hypothetical protein